MTSMIRTGAKPARALRRSFSPFPELMELQRVFGGNPFFGEEQTRTNWQPSVDIFEASNEIVIKMEIPEVKKEDIQVNLEGQTLTISGERKLEHEEQKDGYHRIERTYGQFARSFTIPPNVNREELTAEYSEGVLKIALPKRDEAKPRQITVG